MVAMAFDGASEFLDRFGAFQHYQGQIIGLQNQENLEHSIADKLNEMINQAKQELPVNLNEFSECIHRAAVIIIRSDKVQFWAKSRQTTK